MSSKSSSSSALSSSSSSLSSSSSSSASSSSPTPTPHVTLSTVSPLNKVKKEPPDDEIKEYAANAMSELLGWYGYEKVDSRCTRGLNLDHFVLDSTCPKPHRNYQQTPHQSRIIKSRCVNNRQSLSVHHQQTAASSSPQSTTSQSPLINTISLVSNKESDVAQVSPPLSLRPTAVSPPPLEHTDASSDIPDSSTTCTWCGRTGGTWDPGSATLLCGIDNSSGQFCSEACFAAGRRAAFKRARTCDWCRHVRHSVSYVDFQDGESQLQFCSDKCLNQYKMNIFCRETQAHLALHGLASLSSNNPKTSGGLITPELWLKDCRSPPSSSTEDEALIVDDEPPICPVKCAENHEHIIEHMHTNNERQLLVETVETISSTPRQTHNFNDTINDIFNEETEEAIRESLKDEEERQIQKCKAQMNEVKSFHTRVELNSPIACRQSPSSPECSKQYSANYAREGKIYLKDVRKLLAKDLEKMCHHQVSDYRSRKISKSTSEHHINCQPLPQSIGIPQPFLPRPMPIKFTPRPGNFRVSSPIAMAPPPSHSLHRQISTTNSQAGLLPPVTVLVPYPIPIPIPLPIPIPIPLFGKFFNLNNMNLCGEKGEKESSPTDDTAGANIEISIVPEDLSQRGQTINLQRKNIPKQNQAINVDGEAVCFSDSSTTSSATFSSATSCAQFPTTNTTDILPVIPIASSDMNSRPLRKRRRQSLAADQIDIRLKRRSKFVPV